MEPQETQEQLHTVPAEQPKPSEPTPSQGIAELEKRADNLSIGIKNIVSHTILILKKYGKNIENKDEM